MSTTVKWDPKDSRHAFEGRIPRSLLEEQWSCKKHGDLLRDVLRRLHVINACALPPQNGIFQEDHRADYGKDCEKLGKIDKEIAFLLGREKGVEDGEGEMRVATKLSRSTARGILSVLNPLKDSYSHGGFVGDWTPPKDTDQEEATGALLNSASKKKKTRTEKEIWLDDWMRRGQREVAEGKLFKNIYDSGAGAILLVDWQQTEYVSAAPKEIKLKWVLVVPILHFGECIALLTLDFEEEPVFGSITNGTRLPTSTFDDKAAALYLICHLAVAPLLVRKAVEADETMMDSVHRALISPMKVTYRNLTQASDALDALDKGRRNFSGIEQELRRVIRILDKEARRGLGHVNALRPLEPPFRVEGFEVVNDTFQRMVTSTWRQVIDMEANPGSGWAVAEHWLKVETVSPLPPPLPLPEPVLSELLRELLSNSYHAVCELWIDPLAVDDLKRRKEAQDKATRSGEVLPFITVKALDALSVKAALGRSAKAGIVVEDRGIGMSPHARGRSQRFGFSGRERGSGWGLAIVKRQLGAVGAELLVRPGYLGAHSWREDDRGCTVAMLFLDRRKGHEL